MKKNYRETVNSIQAGKIDQVYFLNGDDFFLQNYFIKEVEKALAKTAQPERIFLVPEAGEYGRVVQELNSISLFPQPRLFVLYNPIQIKGKNREELLAYCKSPNPDNCLVIVIDKYDPQRKIIKDLSGIVGSINTSSPFPERMAGWVNFFLKENNVTATGDAVDRLLELSGDSVYHLANEIQKIILGLGDRTTVVEEDVLRYAGWRRNYFPWHFLDAVGNRSFDQAVLIGKSLLDQGSDVSLLISLLTTLFQELLFKQLDNSEGKSREFKVFWLSRPIKQRLPNYQKRYTKIELQRIFRILARADRKVKSSGGDVNSILIPLIYRITIKDA